MANLDISARAGLGRRGGSQGRAGGNGEVTEASAEGPSNCMRGDRTWAGEGPAMQWGRVDTRPCRGALRLLAGSQQ